MGEIETVLRIRVEGTDVFFDNQGVCHILNKRNNNEVVARNEFGVDVCLKIKDLKKK